MTVHGHPRRAAATLALALGALACAGPQEGWRRYDLWRHAPAVEVDGTVDPSLAAEATTRLLGAGVANPRRPDDVDTRFGGKLRVLELAAGPAMVWQVELGRRPHLSFVPMTPSSAGCTVTYSLAVRRGGGERSVHDRPHQPAAAAVFGADTVDVDLAEYAGQRVGLVARATADGPDCPAEPPVVAWGSPAVYSHGRFTVAERPDPRPGPNVVLIAVDTLRADHLGAWGRTPSVTPALDALAAESDVWLDAYSTFNVTNPSFASIMTGLYGKNHGVYDLRTPLPDSHQTLAELFRAAGYRTHAVASATHLGREQSGLGQGFEGYRLPWGQFAAELAVDQAMEWLQDVDEGPFFLWLHLFDPHTPHTPPEPYALGRRPAADSGMVPIRSWLDFRPPGPLPFRSKELGGHADLYLGEIAYTDRHLGRFLDFLDSRGLLAETVVAFTADHGENLGEQGVLYRHAGLWDATVHVPLMIRWPGPRSPDRGRRFQGLVQTVDLFPTLLDFSGLQVPDQDGLDLRQLTADGRRGRRLVFAEATDRRAQMVRSHDHLLTRITAADHFLLDRDTYFFDLAADPRQEHNLAGQGLEEEARLGELLDRWLADRRGFQEAPAVDLAPEEIEQLRALGYIDP